MFHYPLSTRNYFRTFYYPLLSSTSLNCTDLLFRCLHLFLSQTSSTSIIFHLMILTNLPWLSWLNFFLYLAHFPLSLHLYYSTLFSHIWLLSKTPLTPRRHMYLSLRVALWAPPTHDPSPAARVWCGICPCAVVVTACQAVRRCHAGQVHGPASEKLHCHTVYTCPSALQPWEKVYPRE